MLIAVSTATSVAVSELLDVRTNLEGGATIYEADGRLLLDGTPNLDRGETLHNPDGRAQATTRPGLDGDNLDVEPVDEASQGMGILPESRHSERRLILLDPRGR